MSLGDEAVVRVLALLPFSYIHPCIESDTHWIVYRMDTQDRLLLLFFPSKHPKLDHFHLQTLAIHQDHLARFMELGYRQQPHALSRGLVLHFRVGVGV